LGALVRRREFMTLAGGMVVWPLAAHAQPQAMPVIGWVSPATIKLTKWWPADVSKGLAEHGFVEGQNFRFEGREANFHFDLVPNLFRELVDQKVSVIIAGTTLTLQAAKAATQSIPIVFAIGIDPVENGFVASLNKPGGNITGIFVLDLMLANKRIEIFHELIPSATKFAYLTDPEDVLVNGLQLPQVQAAADSLGLSLLNVYAHTPDEFEAAFETAVRGGAGGMVIGAQGIFRNHFELVALADRYRLLAMHIEAAAVIAGGLISYNTDGRDTVRLMGGYIARILKGEKPADIPVQQSTKTRLMINLKTAAAMGITVPIPLLGRADEVIE